MIHFFRIWHKYDIKSRTPLPKQAVMFSAKFEAGDGKYAKGIDLIREVREREREREK